MKSISTITMIFSFILLLVVSANAAALIDVRILSQDNPSVEDKNPNVPEGSDIEGYTPDSNINPELPANPGKKWEIKGTPKEEIDTPKP